MIILELYQIDYSKDLVVFDSLEEGKAFVAQIPGYTLEKEDGFEVEYLNPKHLPDYMEIIYKGNIVPFSKFCSTLRKMWILFGKRFRTYLLKTIK